MQRMAKMVAMTPLQQWKMTTRYSFQVPCIEYASSLCQTHRNKLVLVGVQNRTQTYSFTLHSRVSVQELLEYSINTERDASRMAWKIDSALRVIRFFT